MSNSKQSSVDKEFVPYEEALALKELGFDEPCFGYFNTTSYLGIGSFVFKECDKSTIDGYGNKPLLRPTFSQAFRWFRENHDLQYWINNGGYLGKVLIKITGYKHDNFYFSSSEPMEYEEAEEVACLRNLIEIVKEK